MREQDVAEIVHDLRAPLSTISLEACLLEGRLADSLNGDGKRAVGRIVRNVAFLDRMIQDLLDACTIEAGRFAIHRAPTELRALLESVVERTVATSDRDRITLELCEPLTLDVDNLRIERVIANLLQNALKYAPRPSGIAVRLELDTKLVRVSVTDAGPGIRAVDLDYIFDKYSRAEAAHSHSGWGLGLYVSKQIVEAHGGTIGVASVHGSGSTFYFELPRV